MEKLVYALWDVPEGLVERVGSELLGLGPHALTINVVDPSVDMSATVAVPDNGIAATVGLWLDSLDDRGPFEGVLGGAASRMAGYLVTESVPLAYERRTWPDGERSPGVKQITMFDKRAGIDDAQFFARWHGSHTPLTFEVHPVCLYVRHAIARPVTDGAPRWRGIVEEGLREVEDLTDPMRYFSAGGSADTLEHNVKRVMDDVSSFLDLDSVESYPAAEYILRTLPA
ncbi:MAG TPA: hypothetical protein VKI01_05390 [Acidimicrobiia bacterium]|jgi:hypothetical protein|nr:hypothetical protein [Acidimicrobiia bacterium]